MKDKGQKKIMKLKHLIIKRKDNIIWSWEKKMHKKNSKKIIISFLVEKWKKNK